MAFRKAIDPLNLIRVMPAKGSGIDESRILRVGLPAVLFSRLGETRRIVSHTEAPLNSSSASLNVQSRVATQIKILAEVAGAVALAGALNLVKVFNLPQGGSITLVSMAPIILLALRRGAKVGIVAGILFGLVVLVEEPFVVHPIQLLLDYPLAFGALGLAGFFQRDHWKSLTQTRRLLRRLLPITGVVVAITARFVSHFVSGIVYFASYAPYPQDLTSVAIYSAAYNASYLLPEMFFTGIVISMLVRFRALELYR